MNSSSKWEAESEVNLRGRTHADVSKNVFCGILSHFRPKTVDFIGLGIVLSLSDSFRAHLETFLMRFEASNPLKLLSKFRKIVCLKRLAESSGYADPVVENSSFYAPIREIDFSGALTNRLERPRSATKALEALQMLQSNARW